MYHEEAIPEKSASPDILKYGPDSAKTEKDFQGGLDLGLFSNLSFDLY